MVLASLSVECEQRYTAISKTCWFSSNPILLKRDICIFLKPKETLRALLFCQFSEYPCCCTRGHTKQSQHTLWTKNRFATLVGLVGNPVSRVFSRFDQMQSGGYCPGTVQKIHAAMVLACVSVQCEQPAIYSDFQNFFVLQ